jgi:hypothetical protein
LLGQLFFLVLREKALFYIFVFHGFKQSSHSFICSCNNARYSNSKTEKVPRGSKAQVDEVKEGSMLDTSQSRKLSLRAAMAERMNHQPFRIVAFPV